MHHIAPVLIGIFEPCFSVGGSQAVEHLRPVPPLVRSQRHDTTYRILARRSVALAGTGASCQVICAVPLPSEVGLCPGRYRGASSLGVASCSFVLVQQDSAGTPSGAVRAFQRRRPRPTPTWKRRLGRWANVVWTRRRVALSSQWARIGGGLDEARETRTQHR